MAIGGDFLMAIQQTTARLEARLPVEVHATLRRAAEIEGRTHTGFVVGAAHEAALHTIESTEIIRLASADQLRFAEALIDTPCQMPRCDEPKNITVA
jgi:uncharacterized protein (DUF1778 family)